MRQFGREGAGELAPPQPLFLLYPSLCQAGPHVGLEGKGVYSQPLSQSWQRSVENGGAKGENQTPPNSLILMKVICICIEVCLLCLSPTSLFW